MLTSDFLALVLPDEGLKCIALQKPKGFLHTFFTDVSAAAEYAEDRDAEGATVYFACASFLTADNRKGENVAFVRSLWLDI